MIEPVSLGNKSMMNIFNCFKTDKFTFIFDSKEVTVSKTEACAISNVAAKYILNDITANSIYFDVFFDENDNIYNEDAFMKSIDQYFSILTNGTLEITPNLFFFYKKLAYLLETEDLYQPLKRYADDVELNEETAALKIVKSLHERVYPKEEIQFCADNLLTMIRKKNVFDELKWLRKGQISAANIISDIYNLFFQQSINNRSSSISSILNFTLDLFHDDKFSFFEVIRSIPIMYASKESIISMIELFNDEGNPSYALLSNWIKNQNISDKDRFIVIDYKNDKLNGIFSYLTKESDGNPLISNKVQGYAPREKLSRPLYNVVDFTDINSYYLNFFVLDGNRVPNKNENYFQFDFRDITVNVTGYSIRTTENKLRPKTWTIFGSNDGDSWEIIDTKKNNYELNQSYHTVYFKANKNSNFYRYIRYAQYENHYDEKVYKYGFELSAFELFGIIDKG